MDDTQMSRALDAAATRKRRSSILKSQRPPRTPFSELEFNVATPTDTAKSRRVSFSRRTGVAEFATNEATTTWKNFYEEHNKSLESSGNNSASKHIGHIGKRIFDQQFEEVEVDLVGIQNPGYTNKSLSLNSFDHQLLSLDRTEELKLSGHHSIMNLSKFTNTELFSEPAMPCGEVTDRIDINFSNIQPIANDDLDDIQNDLRQNFQSAFKRQNMSEYIEVDLNMTQAVQRDDDMSITDTVHSPEVHVPINVEISGGNLKLGQSDDLDEIQRDLNHKYGHESSMSQSINSLKVLDSKMKLIDSNCVVDKENIAVNPYAPLRETENFAVNEEDDKVLVFDGKRLTLQADKVHDVPLPPKPINAQRKTIVLNLHDDLPNFVNDSNTTGLMDVRQLKNVVLEDISITEPVLDINKRTFIYDEEQGNISITQVVSTNIVSEDKSNTIHYDDCEGNISMTQVLPTKISEKRRTIVYDDEEGDMSITKALPSNFLSTNVQNEKRKTIVFNDGNMSITQAIPSNIIPENTMKRSIFAEDVKDISNIPINEAQEQKTEKRRTVYEDDEADMSITRALPNNFSSTNVQNEKRKTIVFNDGNMSITQAIPSNIIPDNTMKRSIFAEDVKDISNIPINEAQEQKTEKRRTVYDDDEADMSITRALPTNFSSTNVQNEKRKTIVFNDGNMSITQAIPSNIIPDNTMKRSIFAEDVKDISNIPINEAQEQKTEKRRTIVYEDDSCKFSVTQATNSNNSIACKQSSDRRRTVIFEADTGNISVTQVVPSEIIQEKVNEAKIVVAENLISNIESQNEKMTRRTIVYENDTGDLSITQSVPNHIIKTNPAQGFASPKCISAEGAGNEDTTANSDTNKRKTIVFDNDEADISMTQAVSLNQVLCDIRHENKGQPTKITNENCSQYGVNKKSFVFDKNYANISITQAVPTNVIECFNLSVNEITDKATNSKNCDKRRTIVFENDEGDISMTQVINTKTIVQPNVCSKQDGPNVQEDFVLEALHEALHNKKSKGHRTIIYEKEDDNLSISENQQSEIKHAQSISIQGNVIKQINTVSDDFNSAADSLADILVRIQNNDENKKSNEQDVPMIDVINSDDNENVDTEQRFDMSSRNEIKKVIRKALSSEEQSMSSKTNLPSLTKLQNDLEKSIRNEMSMVIRENHNEAIVFQTALSLLTDKGDSKSANVEDTFHVTLSSSSKTDNDYELKKIENVSSEIHTNDINNTEPQNENKSPRKIPNDNTSISQDSEKTSARSKSILNDLLDMSSSNSQNAETREDAKPKGDDELSKIGSNEGGIFLIIHDDKETSGQTEVTENTPQLIVQSPLTLEYKEKSIYETQPLSQKIQNKIKNIKEVLVKSTNKTIDKIRTPNLKGKSKERREKSAPFSTRGHLALENKCEAEAEPEIRESFLPRRQSIVISRDDLLSNISMAGAALKSQIDSDDEDLEDSLKPEKSRINNVVMSNEVVKTLQFDESTTESNVFQKLLTTLQKSAFNETADARDTKSNVIPQFLDVSDGIKELIDDLVKPNPDVLPFDSSLAEKATSKKASTHSTQIQANLVTSSQVELEGLASDSIYTLNMSKTSSTDIINEAVNRSVTRALKSPIKPFTTEEPGKHSEIEDVKRSARITSPAKHIESPSRVLVFDHFNPLNNILLAPKVFQEAHAYNPVPSEDESVSERSNSAQTSLNNKDIDSTENVSLQYNVTNFRHCMKQSGDSTFSQLKSFTQAELSSQLSLVSKSRTIDQSTEVINEKDLKSAKVNTLIVMKGNMDLLEDHSSLTLVDDTLAQSTFDVTISPGPPSAMKVLYSVDRADILSDIIDSELTSNDEVKRKSKKRGRDKHKQVADRLSLHKESETTPKPNKKILKISQSPNTIKPIETQHETKYEKGSVKSAKDNNKAENMSFQNLLAEYKPKPKDPASIQEKIMEAINKSKSAISSLEPLQTESQSDADSSEMESSCTSSKNLRDDVSRVTSTSSKVSKMDWQPELLGNEVGECESGVNVMDMINKLPFMGRECEWEVTAADMWSFLLLHGRIRLMLRLEHRFDNAARTHIHADTAVQLINVEILHHDTKNSLATLCVRFAADTMQWFVNQGCHTARDVPALVRRCAAAARLAARWGRLMTEARHHLAYSLTPQGLVTLKVANIPLRCVWEVSLRLRLAQGGAPWVQACEVGVQRVLSVTPPRDSGDPARLLRRLPKDWSHAPRAIWKLFKHFKHMTREEDEEFFTG